MNISASPTANWRYVEIELADESITATTLLTPEEAQELLATLTEALFELRRKKPIK